MQRRTTSPSNQNNRRQGHASRSLPRATTPPDDAHQATTESTQQQGMIMMEKRAKHARKISRTSAPYWFWCAMCVLSFCSALFCVGIVNTLILQHAYLDYYRDQQQEDVTNEAYIRRRMKRQKQQEHKREESLSVWHEENNDHQRYRIEEQWRPPQAVERARLWEEEAAFGLEDEESLLDIVENDHDNVQNNNNNREQQQPGPNNIGERYAGMIQSRRDQRDERRREYDRQRQQQRKAIRRSTVSKRVAGGVFYDRQADAKVNSSWFAWLWQSMMGSSRTTHKQRREADESIFDSGDLPQMDFKSHYEALVKGWEKEGIFWNYQLPAVADPQFTLAAPQARAARVVVIVLSTRHQMEMRNVIRETWGKDHVVYFVVGGRVDNKEEEQQPDDAQLESELQQEANQYRDILDTIHPESYRSLPYKLHFAYKFVTREIPEAKWILKLDDDMVARISTLDQAILNKLNPEQPFVLGKIVPNAKVSRVGKWAEYLYEKRYYPFWPKGSHGHVVSRPVAEYVASMTNVTYYQGEDTSLGIWLSESSLGVTWICSPYFQNHGRCEEDEWIVIGHQISPGHMRECFDKLDEWHLDQFADKQRNFWFLESRAQRKWMSDVVESRRQDEMFPMFS